MRFVVSLGGSLIAPDNVDTQFLKELKSIINKSRHEFIIICGGGMTARNYINSAKEFKVSNINLDLIGMKATQLNAILVAGALEGRVAKRITDIKEWNDKIIVGFGYFPGMTTDADSVVAAGLIGATAVINLSNVAGVYDMDPKKFKGAKMFDKMTHKELLKLAQQAGLGLGANFIFDLHACKLAERDTIKLIFLKGLDNFEKFINNKKFIGTTVQ